MQMLKHIVVSLLSAALGAALALPFSFGGPFVLSVAVLTFGGTLLALGAHCTSSDADSPLG